MKEKIINITKGEDKNEYIYLKRFGLWLRFHKHTKMDVYLLTTYNRYDEPFVFTTMNRKAIFNTLFKVVDTCNNVLISFDNDREQELFSLFVANKKMLG